MKQTFAAKFFAAKFFASGLWAGVGVAMPAAKPQRIDEQSFSLALASQRTPPVTFRIFREGVLSDTIFSTTGYATALFQVRPGDHPFIEVLDHPDDAPSPAFPGRLLLHWQGVSGAISYRVEELVSAVWTLRATIQDDGAGAYSWQSRWLEDVTTHQFRTSAVDAAGNVGTPVAVTFFLVRHPDAPSVTYAWSAGTTKVTIS